MNLKKCSNGHYYDSEKYTSCPQCRNEGTLDAGNYNSAQYQSSTDNYDATTPIGGTSSGGGNWSETLSESSFVDDAYGNETKATEAVTEGFQPSFEDGVNGVEDYKGGTEPVSLDGVRGFAPVVGWLVCVDGPERGKDYRIKPGYNYIGREERMDICLRGDSKVSGNRDSLILYDDDTKIFYFGHQNGMNPVRVNGKPVINPIELSAFDMILIGSTKLIFVPLCGEKFDWKTIG